MDGWESSRYHLDPSKVSNIKLTEAEAQVTTLLQRVSDDECLGTTVRVAGKFTIRHVLFAKFNYSVQFFQGVG